MKDNIIANIIFIAVGIAILTGIFEDSLMVNTVDNLYTLSGLSLGIFGVWAGIRLIKLNK